MVVVTATPHLRAPRSFGLPQGLRALAALAFCLALTAFTLPTVQTRLVASGPAQPAFGPVAQTLLAFWAGGAGVILLLQALRSPPAAAGTRALWALVAFAAGLAILLLIPLRVVLAEGRFGGDMAAWTIGLGNLFVGLTVLLFGIDALRRRPVGRHAGLPRAHPTAAPAMAGWAREPVRSQHPSPGLSPVDIVAWGSSAAHPRGFTFQTGPAPILLPTARATPSLGGSGPSRRAIYASEVPLPLRVFAFLLLLMPLLLLLSKLLHAK